MGIVEFNDVWEMYRLKLVVQGKTQWENFWALRNITFDLQRGDVLGVIGENGSGKSTLLKMIVGVIQPSRGKIAVQGRAAGLLDLGAGFQPELTGHDNIFFNANLFGLSPKQIEHVYDDIIAFAALGKFIYAPVHCYSQGMFVRLSFAVAIHMDPDILVIDDTLSVGDAYYQKKCLQKIFELKEMGKTIVFATHDMAVLKKLSQRAILLREGRIIQDGSLHKVVPLYTQTVGGRPGVATLKKGDLGLVFNNGKVFLNWQDRPLTPQQGIYVRVLVNERWGSSFEADWQVEEKEDGFEARGSYYQFDLIQVWRMQLFADGQVVFHIHFEGGDSIDVRDRYVRMMVSPEYQRWRTLTEQGDFPSIDAQQESWSNVAGGDLAPDHVGLESREGIMSVPSLIVEQIGPSGASRMRFLNTDGFTNARVIEYSEQRSVREGSSPDLSGLNFEGKILVGRPDLTTYFDEVQSQCVLSGQHLKLLFGKGQCSLFADGKRLTKLRNLSTFFYVEKALCSSEWARWECRKEGQGKLIAKGVWPGFGITQLWTFELLSDRSFSWKVDMEVLSPVSVPEQSMRLMFSEHYDLFLDEYGPHFFSSKFTENEIDVLQRSIAAGKIRLVDSRGIFPAFSAEISGQEDSFLKVFNTDMASRARDLRVGRVSPEEEEVVGPGNHFCFKLIGCVGGSSGADEIEPGADEVVKKGAVGFSFSHGSGRIFWKDRELTKRLGVYTAFCIDGRWCNAPSDAVWSLKDKTGGRQFVGRWLKLPVVQSWHFDLEEDGAVHCKIGLDVREPLRFEQLQVNLMFSELYKQWRVGDRSGEFPEFDPHASETWPVICRSPEVRDGTIAAVRIESAPDRETDLPAIQLSLAGALHPQLRHTLGVLNTDVCHRGRILQCRIEPNGSALAPGEYALCDFRVSLGKKAMNLWAT